MSDWNIVKALRSRAVTQTATGITEPSEHIDWMAADEIEKLRAALKPFADAVKDEHNWKYDINVDDFHAAAAALKETGDD